MVHFISGLPRSGSTLLAALLNQNDRFCANITSPVGMMFNAMLSAASQRNESAVFISDRDRKRLLRMVFDAYYGDDDKPPVYFDTNRLWCAKLPALVEIFPDCKVICMVRNPAWIIDSIERLLHRNPLQLSGIFNFEPNNTVYSRADGLAKPDGLLGFAYGALKEAVFGPYRSHLMLVTYERFVRHPLDTMAQIYNFLGENRYEHDVKDVTPLETDDFDNRLGMPGLHEVRPEIKPPSKPSILPPDLFQRFANDDFWNHPIEGLRLIGGWTAIQEA